MGTAAHSLQLYYWFLIKRVLQPRQKTNILCLCLNTLDYNFFFLMMLVFLFLLL
jgi:hypothetical protein